MLYVEIAILIWSIQLCTIDDTIKLELYTAHDIIEPLTNYMKIIITNYYLT